MDIIKLRKVFAERLAEQMQERNLTVSEFATEVKLSPRTIYQWLSRARSIQIDSLCKLCNFFGCTADYFLGRANY